MRIPAPALICLILLTFAVDWYILRDIKQYISRKWKKVFYGVYLATAIICWLVLAVIAFWPLRSPDHDTFVVMWLLFGYLSIYIPKAFYTICSLLGRFFFRNHHANFGAMFGGTVAMLVFIVMWWGVFFTRHELDLQKVEISSPRIPTAFNGYRIVQFSDVHVGTWGNDTLFVSSLVDSINSLNPDMIVFTGDIVNRKTKELNPFIDIFGRLRAKDGVYSILGNHDYGDYVDWKSPSDREENNRELSRLQKKMGWTLLNNKGAWIKRDNDSIALVGVENWGDPPFKCYGDLQAAVKNIPGKFGSYDDNYKILLTHNPEHWNQVVTNESNFDLTLSGHTHAMQASVGEGGNRISPAVFRYKYWGGLYNRTSADSIPMNLYVNIGSGEVGIPVRIGSAVPEITLFELKSVSTK